MRHLKRELPKKLTEASTWFRASETNENNENNMPPKEKFKVENQTWKNWRQEKRLFKIGRKKNLEGKIIVDPERNKEKKIEGVIFIQHTEHSTLARNIRCRLQELEKNGKIKIKIVERAGEKLVDLLHRSDAWSNRDCDRLDCLICESAGEEGTKGACKRRSIIYETYCVTCQEEKEKLEEIRNDNKETTERDENKKRKLENNNEKEKKNMKDYKIKYIGESYRSAFERGCEHRDDLKYKREKSHLLKHFIVAHPGTKLEDLKFGMRVVRKCKTALERQVGEAVSIHIAQREGYTLLNSKSEYSRCSLPRLQMGTHREILEKLQNEKLEEKYLEEKIRQMKKRPKEKEKGLERICEEIIEENRISWKKRKVLRGKEKKLQDEKDLRDWEKFHRLERAKRKKAELLKRLENTEIKVGGKSLTWIKNKQRLWREFREKEGIDKDDERELINKLIEKIPIREKKEEGKTTVVPSENDEKEKREEVTVDLEGKQKERKEDIVKRGRLCILKRGTVKRENQIGQKGEGEVDSEREFGKREGTELEKFKRGRMILKDRVEGITEKSEKKREKYLLSPKQDGQTSSLLEREVLEGTKLRHELSEEGDSVVGGGLLDESECMRLRATQEPDVLDLACGVQKPVRDCNSTLKENNLSMQFGRGGMLDFEGEDKVKGAKMGGRMVESEIKAISATDGPSKVSYVNSPCTDLIRSHRAGLLPNLEVAPIHSLHEVELTNRFSVKKDVKDDLVDISVKKLIDIDSETNAKSVESSLNIPNYNDVKRHLSVANENSTCVSQSDLSYDSKQLTVISSKCDIDISNKIAKFSPSRSEPKNIKNLRNVGIATLGPSEIRIQNQSQNKNNKLPFLLQCDPSMDGNKGKIEVENKAKINLNSTKFVTSKTKAEQNLGARPKILDKPPENNSTKSRSKLNSNSEKAGKSELELAFARMRSKKEEKLGPIISKSSKTPSKTSPTKLLSKVRRSPKDIMREIKHK